jgi:hypothetical protein
MISKAREASPSKGFKIGQRRREIEVGRVGAPLPALMGRMRMVKRKSPHDPFIPRSIGLAVLLVGKDRYYWWVRSTQIDGAQI